MFDFRTLFRILKFACFAAALQPSSPAAETSFPDTLSLSGAWRFSLRGVEPHFPQAASLPAEWPDSIDLPGTTETRGKGEPNAAKEAGMLTRVRKFEGPAWYQKDVYVPEEWGGRRLWLRLERAKYTQVWFDGRPCGEQTLYTVPQLHDLGSAVPGCHVLTVLVDNRLERRPVPATAHQYSDDTQTNWNGILGRIELSAPPRVSLERVEVRPDVEKRLFHLRLHLVNEESAPVPAHLRLEASSWNHPQAPHVPPPLEFSVEVPPGHSVGERDYVLGGKAVFWDEFSPALYRLTAELSSSFGLSTRTENAGLRSFRTKNSQFSINGRTTFLRGKHDGCVFPLTGHPPMEEEGWLRYFRICREYGLNHVRCHTWVPPEAAFAAADRTGIYLQPELPFWGTYDAEASEGLMPEAERLLEEYGNHASFVMMTLGNEMGGDRDCMNAALVRLRAKDGSRLYSDGSNNYLWEPRQQPQADFWVSAKVQTEATRYRSAPVRGSFCVFDGDEGFVQWGPSNTLYDLRAQIAGVTVPVVGHETGQWTVYPNFAERAKYVGVLAPRNFDLFRASLERHGMLAQADAFFRASGALAVQLYKEEIELALRTPGLGGFQLLDLQDYPGQGTALVGVLDAFMDSKGLVAPERWRESCSEIVPLARFERYVWRSGETFGAELEAAHYGEKAFVSPKVTWRLGDETFEVGTGCLEPGALGAGGLRFLGRISLALPDLGRAAKLELCVRVEDSGRSYCNRWPVWVYPVEKKPAPAKGVNVVRAFDASTLRLLEAGARVVLIPEGRNWADTVPGAYATDYWSWTMFNGTPGTMGLLCEKSHPSLSGFPTETHSERQWAEIVRASTPVVLAEAPAGLRPVVQVIDNLARNEKLGLVFEVRAGAGRLLVCASDLLSLEERHPEARRLLSCLLDYAASPAFEPATSVEPGALARILTPSLAQGAKITASSYFHPPWGSVPAPERIVDGDICTKWIADEKDAAPSLVLDLGVPRRLSALELYWEHDEAGYRYLAECSLDGSNWSLLVDERDNRFSTGRHFLVFAPAEARWVRIAVTKFPDGRRVALRELRLPAIP